MKERYKDVPPIGIYSFTAFSGVLIFNPEEEDRYKDRCDLVACYEDYGVRTGYHKHMIHYATAGRPYIRKGNFRIYLDEVMKNIYWQIISSILL